MTDVNLSFTVDRSGPKVLVTVRKGENIVYADRCDPGSAGSRKLLLKGMLESHPDAAPLAAQIEARLLHELVAQPAPAPNPTELEPWDQPVTTAEILDEIRSILLRFAILPPHGAERIALWIAHTYVFEGFQYSPRLLVTGPQKRCGKSLVIRLIGALCHAPRRCDGITSAALFRTIEAHQPTMLLDEADTFLGGPRPNEDLRGVINSGHQKGGAIVRCVGDDHEPVEFGVFCPLVLSMIGKPPDTIEDRSVIVSMRRKQRHEKVERLPIGQDLRRYFEPTQRKLLRWAEDHRETLTAIRPQVPEQLDDRAGDNWFALIAIAETAGETWSELAQAAAKNDQELRSESSEGDGIMLLEDIRMVFCAEPDDRITTAHLLRQLCSLEERPWPNYRPGQGINPMQLAGLLRPFGIKSMNMRVGDKVVKGYCRSAFEDAIGRYLPPPSAPAE
jgi:hypothetical protein